MCIGSSRRSFRYFFVMSCSMLGYKEKFATPYQAAELGFIDEIIYPRQTRKRLIQALEMTENKMQTNPPKKHGNMPL